MELTVEEQIELDYLESMAKYGLISDIWPSVNPLIYLDENDGIRYQELTIKLIGES